MPKITRKTALWTLFIGATVFMFGAGSSAPIQKKPVPRRDAFFGLHFDLHPSETDLALGADISEENIGKLLERVRPDYVQYDCKGHVGWAGFPTKVGWPAPGIKKDSLAVWRKATRERGVGLYIHYSGVWDGQAIAHHPDWARIDEKGGRDPNNTSVFGPYKDELLIPQLKEVVAAYGLDGLWVDGECWAAQLDYSPSLSVDRARVEARYLASTGMPWDLMAWGFDKGKDQGWSIKTPVQLMQEAAVVLMAGGGFQIYHQPTRSGYIAEAIIDQEGRVADFCAARKEASFKSRTVPQVALLLSAESHWDKSDRVFAPWGGEFDDLEGALHALLELHYSVDILAEHQLSAGQRMNEFPLVVVPDSPKLSEEFKAALLRYVERGGSLLLMGEKCARLFEPALGVKFIGAARSVNEELTTPAGPVGIGGEWQEAAPTTAKTAGLRYATRDTRKEAKTATTIVSYGKGKIGAVFGPLANIFFKGHHPYVRQFIGELTKELFPEPAVIVDGPPALDVALRTTKEGKMSLHLLNRSNLPLPDRYNFTDYIPAAGPITVRMKLEAKPKKVTLVPDGTKIKWTWKKGWLTAAIPQVHIHSVLVMN